MTQNKVLWLNEHQTPLYYNAKVAVMQEKGSDLTEGQVIKELCKAYTGTSECELPVICSMINETAAQNGDPVYTQEQLDEMGQHELRRLARDASSDEINGKSTKQEVYAYYTCPCPKEDSNVYSKSE